MISGVLTASMLSACSLPVNITIDVGGQKYSVGTAGDTDAEAPVEDIKLPDDETYESDHGWSVRYVPSLFTVNESDNETDFVYTGESAGTNMVAIQTIEDKLPPEVIDELTKSHKDMVIREGSLGGDENRWAIWVMPGPDEVQESENGSRIYEDYIVTEYNGGTLLLSFITHISGQDELDTAVSDYISMIVDTLVLDPSEPQTMYNDRPGTYVRSNTDELDGNELVKTDVLQLNHDHTGFLSLQDDIPILWGYKKIMGTQGDFFYDYTLDGDRLTLNYDGTELEFIREGREHELSVDITGCDTFTHIVDRLSDGQGYANVKLGDTDVLLVSSGTYEDLDGKYVAIDAEIFVYGQNGPEYLGYVECGGTAYPLTLDDDNSLYVCSNHRAEEYTVQDGRLFLEKEVWVEYDGEGNPTYGYADYDYDDGEVDIETDQTEAEEEFEDMFDELSYGQTIEFTRVVK